MERKKIANNLLKAAGGKRNIHHVWTIGRKIYFYLVYPYKFNTQRMLASEGVVDFIPISDAIYKIEMDKQAFNITEEILQSLKKKKEKKRIAGLLPE